MSHFSVTKTKYNTHVDIVKKYTEQQNVTR